VKPNCRTTFTRNPGALEPLDGLRAIAIIWVFALHVQYLYGKITTLCLGPANSSILTVVMYSLQHGDIGVDIFFVLSGFLISYILMKECHKYEGKIDVFNFYRGRVLRLYGPLVIATAILAIFIGKIVWLTLLFVNNIFYGENNEGFVHTWSVAVEMQMYLISPFILIAMYRFKYDVWFIPFIISLISTLINAYFILETDIDETYSRQLYVKTWSRLSPYVFGMTVGYWFVEN